MKVGIYCRVSSDKQKEKGVSLHDQVERGKDFCISNGYDFEVFKDGGYSGTLPIVERPQLDLLMTKIFLNEVKGVYVVDWDRFSRDDKVGFVLKTTFRDNGVKVFDSNGEINLHDESQELLLGIKILLSSYEIKRNKVRIKRSLERGVIEGRVGGGSLINYGYTKGENKKLIIDEFESEVIQLIFNMSVEGSGTKVISNYLNDNGVPTKRMRIQSGSSLKVKGKKKTHFVWRDSVVYSILTNPIYMGQRRFKGSFYPSPVIIKKEQFEVVQQLLKERKHFKDTTNKYFYLLKGMVHCLKCHNRFYGRKREDLSDNQYICSSQRYSDTYCKTRGINIDYLNNYVWDSILKLPNEIRGLIEDDILPLHKRQVKRLKSLNVELKKLHSKKDKLLELYTEKDSGYELIKGHLDKIVDRVGQIKEKIRLLKKEISLTSDKDEIIRYVEGHFVGESNPDDEYKQRVIRSLVKFIGIKWFPQINEHCIWIEYKFDKHSVYRLGRNSILKYKKQGWRMSLEKNDTKLLFRKISPDISKYPKLNLDKDFFGIRLNDKGYLEDNQFRPEI